MEGFQQSFKWKKFQAMLPNLSHIQGEKAQQLITNRSWISGLAGVMKDKVIFFKHLSETFDKGIQYGALNSLGSSI